jgi:hypothetical protein
MSQAETPLCRRIRLGVAGPGSSVRLFRQDCGVAWHGRAREQTAARVVLLEPRRISYGLCPGSPDLVGWRSVKITPPMVGETVAVFVGLEVKTPGGRVSESQRNFLDAAKKAGAIAEVVRGVDDAQRALGVPIVDK